MRCRGGYPAVDYSFVRRIRPARPGPSPVRVRRAVAQLPHAIVRRLHGLVLLLDQPPGLLVDVVFLQREAVRGHRQAFAAFAFGEDGVQFVRPERGLEVDPRAMERTAERAGEAGFRVAAEGADALLQFEDEFRALRGILAED